MTTSDPSRTNYVPYYEDANEEYDRIVRCLQQQIEDCFTTMTRIRRSLNDQHRTSEKMDWDNMRGGLRCWRMAVRQVAPPSKGIEIHVS